MLDEVNKMDENKLIEILVENIWIPAMATDLRIFTKDNELKRVEAMRVRELQETGKVV